MGLAETRQFDCSEPVVGRYMVVQLAGTNYLTLCEVEVFPGEGYKCNIKLQDIHLPIEITEFTSPEVETEPI